MRKTIKIGNKEYEMQSSAYTPYKYKELTGRTLLKDLKELGERIGEKEDAIATYDNIEDFLERIFKLAYVMSLEAKSINCSYEDFLMSIEDYLTDANWIMEVVNLGISPISGNVQAN